MHYQHHFLTRATSGFQGNNIFYLLESLNTNNMLCQRNLELKKINNKHSIFFKYYFSQSGWKINGRWITYGGYLISNRSDKTPKCHIQCDPHQTLNSREQSFGIFLNDNHVVLTRKIHAENTFSGLFCDNQ